MEADFGFWRRRWWLKQRPEFLVGVPQGAVLEQEGIIEFSQAPEDGGVGGEIRTQFDEGAEDVKAQSNGGVR
jgi:hypothetical protein